MTAKLTHHLASTTNGEDKGKGKEWAVYQQEVEAEKTKGLSVMSASSEQEKSADFPMPATSKTLTREQVHILSIFLVFFFYSPILYNRPNAAAENVAYGLSCMGPFQLPINTAYTLE
ncbi:hypothetical protein V8E53_003581 [Lactarius tabidus]